MLFEKALALTRALEALKPESLSFEALEAFVHEREEVYQEIMRRDRSEEGLKEAPSTDAEKRELERQRSEIEKVLREIRMLDQRILPRFSVVEKQMIQKMGDLKKARKIVERYQISGDWHRSTIVDGDA